MVTRILELSRQDPALLKELEKFRRSVAILFTDMQGSTAYYEKFGDVAGFVMVHECNDVLRKVVEEHGGRVVKTIGDAIMACFNECESTVRAAIAMQRRLRELNSTKKEEDQAHVRIGAHYGLGIIKSNDIFGDVVNVASRIQSLALPEQILISGSVYEHVSGSGFAFSPLGQVELKGKSQAQPVYDLNWNQETSARVNPAYTMISSVTLNKQEFKLQHLNRSGKVDAEYRLPGKGLTVGHSEGDLKFPDDPSMYSPHAKIFVQHGRPMVEDISRKGGIYIRLKGVFTLENHDIIGMGGQLFRFESQPDMMAAATAVAITVADVSRILHRNPAELVQLNADSPAQRQTFPITKEDVRFGRTTGDYTFPQDRLMSRAHARVYLRGEDYFLEDLSSLNGTFAKIRGQTPVPLGAALRVGREVFLIL